MLLNCHTYYSYKYGTYAIKQLLTDVYNNGYRAFALTDINSTSAVLETIRLTQHKALKTVVGIDFRNGAEQKYVGLAINNNGYQELNQHLSSYLHGDLMYQDEAPAFNHAYIIYPYNTYKRWHLKDNEFVGVSVADLKRLSFFSHRIAPNKLVVLQQVSFKNKTSFNAHRLLRAIDENTLLSKLSTSSCANGTEMLCPKDELENAFAAYPHIIQNTNALLQQCDVTFEYGRLTNKNKKYYHDSLQSDIDFLRNECLKNISYRYATPHEQASAIARMEKELEVITDKEFASYFLINWDIVQYAKRKNYYHVGRGSGANSIVAYLIGITDVDPIELDLYFERFINKERTNAPDFDVDFSWTDRDDITRYIFERFGGNRQTALLGAYSTFQIDAIIQQLGKVMGLPPNEIKQLKKEWNGLQHDFTLKDKNDIKQLLFYYAKQLYDFPSHLSIHASGIIISEKPIMHYSATFLPPKGYPTTQFSMIEAEDIGLYKFDILSQRGLGKIKDALALIKQNKGEEIDIHATKKFTNDEQVKHLLRTGNAIGCFYVESPGMRMLLTKLKADDYLRLVAASSIIRPGVAQSGMMNEYIDRFRNEHKRIAARNKLPVLYDMLAETYGVMVYQEDVIRVAHVFAGLSLAESDALRRGMSWKFKKRAEFMAVKDSFMKNCLAKGYDEKLINDIWFQIESFANFAFSKGHSASYAVESYQALYLKAHYPIEYMAATLNNGGGFYRTELYVHEARMQGANVFVPCINKSEALSTVSGNNLYLGFNLIGELTQHTIETILMERKNNGAFTGLNDFMNRVSLSMEQLRILIRVGALGFTQKSKKELLWQAHALHKPQTTTNKQVLFTPASKSYQLPPLQDTWLESAFDEMELLGFTLHNPFDMLRNKPTTTLLAKDLANSVGKHIQMVAYLVTIKHTSTSTGKKMFFGTFIDAEGAWVDTVHFPESAKCYPFTGPGCYEIRGKVAKEYDFISIEVSYSKRLSLIDREIASELNMANL